jgi:hypothetical protein
MRNGVTPETPLHGVTALRSSAPRVRRFRERQKSGNRRRLIEATKSNLDALEERGYLDPDRRGDRADETEAIEMFLRDSLTKSR